MWINLRIGKRKNLFSIQSWNTRQNCLVVIVFDFTLVTWERCRNEEGKGKMEKNNNQRSSQIRA